MPLMDRFSGMRGIRSRRIGVYVGRLPGLFRFRMIGHIPLTGWLIPMPEDASEAEPRSDSQIL